MKPAKALTARSTVIALLAAISLALLLACLIPQRASTGGGTLEWAATLPRGVRYLVFLLGLDSIVATGWFATLVGLFSLSLIISTFSQFTAARVQAVRLPAGPPPPGSIRLELSRDRFARLLHAAGYRLAGEGDGVARFVKYRLGYWGNFLIHLGLVTVVLFSLVYILTQHRAMVRLTGDEITRLTPGSFAQLKGVMPVTPALPASLALTNVEPRFWGNDKLEWLGSELYVTDRPGEQPRRVTVALCDKVRHGTFIVYQMNAYGRAFDLLLTAPDGATRQERLFIPYPPARDRAGYGTLAIPGTDLLLKGKFYADAGQVSMKLSTTGLTLRLVRGKELLGEAPLQPGGSARLGPLEVTLIRSAWWTEILLEGSRGTYGIFAGFAVILAGVLCSYCLVPREIIVRESGGGLLVQHLVRRFALFYREEFDALIQSTEAKESP